MALELKQRRAGGVWQAHFEGPDGSRKRLSTGCTNKEEAKLKALAMMQEVLVESVPLSERRGSGLEMTTLASLLREVYHAEWRHKRSAKSIKTRITRIIREIGHWTIPQITRQRLRDWADGLTNENRKDSSTLVSAATKNRYMSAISRAMTYAKEESIPDLTLPKFPHWAENNVKERYLTDDEERRIFDWLRAHPLQHWGREQSYMIAMVGLLLDSGMRISEALGEVTEVNVMRRDGKAVALRLRHGKTKSGEGRLVPLTTRAAASVETLLTHPSHPLTAQAVLRRWNYVCGKLEIEDATLHTLRHTCASRLVLSGVPIYKVSRMLGHSSVTMTERYANVMDGDLLDLAGALEERNGARRVTLSSVS
ncbi:tyrosine-type recombinase/integrase [Stenotrophomonas oahuensis]|uniref:Site-specific integrase n=1 Tax=Stenotrophomonas oahuensis TaxID=3003271 RepID=A0ABY9YND0_9GAMM|nr:site-specific integrase [Stenotrophomonas sp. A5586]WNH52407.1 site-specific integrase [Stenotrophomonas sp. A5586]